MASRKRTVSRRLRPQYSASSSGPETARPVTVETNGNAEGRAPDPSQRGDQLVLQGLELRAMEGVVRGQHLRENVA